MNQFPASIGTIIQEYQQLLSCIENLAQQSPYFRMAIPSKLERLQRLEETYRDIRIFYCSKRLSDLIDIKKNLLFELERLTGRSGSFSLAVKRSALQGRLKKIEDLIRLKEKDIELPLL